MWQIKYTPGAKPGKRKAEQSDKLDDKTAKVAKRNEYEKNKRPERTFNASWKQGRPWLTYIQCCITTSSALAVGPAESL